MIKRFISFTLTLCIIMSIAFVSAPFSLKTDAAAVDVAATTDTGIDYGLVDNVQYGQILHCWNWSFDNIRKNMQLIASQGFTAIQTSPIQSSKESTRESWSSVQNSAWVYYQPISFNIETNSWNALGTKNEFVAMCEEAHKYGVKVIVDAVFNHMANDSSENTINPQITSDLRDDSNCWYSITWNTSNWEDRYDVTHNCLSGFPDLNTSNTKVQNYAIGFLKECIDAGADGFRFDAVKHIETPADAYGTASDFWPNVLGTATYHAQQTRGITPYYYGELLGSPGGGLPVTAYTDHMSVTDNNTGNTVRDAIASGNAAGACQPGISNGAAPDKAVQWNESHDTYYADNNSIWISNDNMKKTWAIVGSRAQVCGLYLARPENNTTTMLGDGDITAWADKEVKAINRFKNYFAGHGEYLAYSGNIVYNERGNTGVVLVNATGGSTSVSVPAHRMYDGVYTDAITGNHFTVSNGNISGQIGSSGIAVVYSYPSTVKVSDSSQAFRGDTFDITLSYVEATGGTYSINGSTPKSYKDGDVISIGCGTKYGEEIDLLVTASGGTTTDSQLYTYKKLHPDTELTMYFDNGSKNWDKVYAYVYDEDGNKNKSWPGIEMTYDSALGLYKYDVPAGFETSKVVFSDGNGNQTPSSGGHSFNAYTSIYKNGSFYGYNTGVENVLYFKPSSDWKSDNARFAVYVWNDSQSSWLNMNDSDSDGTYEVSLPSGIYNECIFARMNPSSTANNWDNVWNRTGDLGVSNNNNYFILGDGWNTSDGTWTVIDKSVINSDSDAYLAGSFNNWSETENPFVYTDYNKAVVSVDLPAGTYTFKLVKGEKWFGNPGTINDTTSGNGWRMCRNDSENCTLVASGGTYTFTLDTENLKINVDYEYKEVVAPTQAPTEAPTASSTQAPTVTPTQTSTNTPTQTPTTAEKLDAGYYLVGTLNGQDCWGASTLTEDRLLKANPNNAGEYMLNYNFVTGDSVKVVKFDGTDITDWYGSGDNYDIGSSKSGECTLYFRPEGNSSWSYNYFTIIPTSSLSAGYYLIGTLGGVDKWGKEDLSVNRLFKENPNNSGEYMLDYTFTAGDEIKVVYFDGNDYTRWYNSSGDNYSIGSSKAGECTVYFRPEGNSSWSYYYFTAIKKQTPATDTPTVATTTPATVAPTQEPTEIPTVIPTQAPTEAPTEAPTQAKPIKVNNIKTTPSATNMAFTWDAVENAFKYWVFKYNESTGTWASSASSYTNSAVVKLLDDSTTYQFKVICKFNDGTMLDIKDADVITATTSKAVATSDITATANIVDVKIDWEPIDGATKYWVYRSTSPDGPFYIFKSAYEPTLIAKDLKPDTTYYFKVIALTNNNGIPCISDVNDSPVISATTKSASLITTKAENITSNSVSISWPAYENAEKYWLKYSTTTNDTSKTDEWKTVASTTDLENLKFTYTKLSKASNYYLSVAVRFTDESGTLRVVDYIPVQVTTLYSDDNFLSFEKVNDTTLKITLPSDLNAQKIWVYAYDSQGNVVTMNSTKTNTINLINISNVEEYTYGVQILDKNGLYGYITPQNGLPYK